MLYITDVAAVVLFTVGFHLAFRQGVLRRVPAMKQLRGGLSDDPEGVASVLRMAGVMIMAFSFTGAVFANLIAHLSRQA